MDYSCGFCGENVESQNDLSELGRCYDCEGNTRTCEVCQVERHEDNMLNNSTCDECGSECSRCNIILTNDEMRGECDCYNTLCENCSYTCEDCSVVMCGDCSNYCELCQFHVCNDHITTCNDCDDSYVYRVRNL